METDHNEQGAVLGVEHGIPRQVRVATEVDSQTLPLALVTFGPISTFSVSAPMLNVPSV